MDDDTRRHHERNGRVAQFGTDNIADWAAGTPGGDLFAGIGTHSENAETNHATFTAKFGESGMDTVTKSTARESVRGQLGDIATAAEAMEALHPGISTQFPHPRRLADADLLASGRAAHDASLPYNADFILYGSFPSTFRTTLNTSCDQFETTISSQGTAIDQRVAARAQAEDEVNEANRKVRLLDPLVRLKYKNNPGMLAAWASASHTEAAPKKKKPPTPVPVSGGGPIPEPPTP